MSDPKLAVQLGDVNEYLASLKASSRFGPQVVHHEEIKGVPPRFADPVKKFSPEFEKILSSLGKGKLYSHQAAAIDRTSA